MITSQEKTTQIINKETQTEDTQSEGQLAKNQVNQYNL